MLEMYETAKTWLMELADRDQLWILHAFGVVLATLVLAMVVSFIIGRLERKAEKSSAIWLALLFRAMRAPVKAIIWLLGISWASYLTHRGADLELMSVVQTVRDVGVVLLITWFMIRFIRYGELEFLQPHKGDPGDPTTVTAISKLLKIAVVVTAGLVLLQTLGYSISGVLAFGGVGGIAVGFAAKDMLANFFGGLTIYLDRPFAVGDWVRSPDQEIEGTVENIGWRQTRIRTFDRRPLYVPNATFTQISVENPSRMEHRRINETIGIRYDDVEKMDDIIADVRQMLIDDDRMETDNQTLIVNFNSFGPSSLDFFIYTFTKTVNWVEFHSIKQSILLKVAEIIIGHGAEIAFPTSTVHVPEGLRLNEKSATRDEQNDDESSSDKTRRPEKVSRQQTKDSRKGEIRDQQSDEGEGSDGD